MIALNSVKKFREVALLFWGITGFVAPCLGHANQPLSSNPSYEKDIRPLLAQYCFRCHGEGKSKPKADVNLARFRDEQDFAVSRKMWKRAWNVLHGNEMPPEGKAQPTPAQREKIIAWIDGMRTRMPANGPLDPGPVVIRRLTRTEYSNTICDLFPSLRPQGVPQYFDPAKGFPTEGVWLGLHEAIERHRVPVVELPPDDADEGFEGLGQTMTLSPLLMEKYMSAAADVLDRVQAKNDVRFFPGKSKAGKSPRETARDIIAGFMPRAFRRPVPAEEIEKYLQLFDLAEQRGESFDSAMKVPLQAILLSPHFLFKAEREPLPVGTVVNKGVRPVGQFELASRLSYFLWSTMPDEELLSLARQGKLRDESVLDAQVRRMLRSPKSKALADNFSVQWLQLGAFETAMPDPQLFPIFYEEYSGLRWTYRQEAMMFFEVLQMEDRSILEFIDSDWAILNAGLAQFYGVADYDGRTFNYGRETPRKEYETWTRYKLPDHRRGGVLTMAAVLTTTSAPTRTSAVKRGQWILETILGAPLPPPPPNAGTLKDDDPKLATMTFRQRLDQHRADPACASCHRRMDPLGFALENYDAIGRWREKEGPLAPLDGEQTWDFNSDGDYEGWSTGYQHGHFRVSGGTLQCGAPNITYLFSPRLHKSAALNKVTVRLKNQTPSQSLRLQFITDSDPSWVEVQGAVFSPARSKTIKIEPHSNFAEYTFDMENVPRWKGLITAMQFNLVDAKEGEFAIDWIRIGTSTQQLSPSVMVDPRATFTTGESFTGSQELKTILLTSRKDDFVRSFTEHLLTYALGRKLADEDAPAVAHIAQVAAGDNYRLSTIVREIVKSDLFQYRRCTESKHE